MCVQLCCWKCRKPFPCLKKWPRYPWFLKIYYWDFRAKIWPVSSLFDTITDKEISNELLQIFQLSDKIFCPRISNWWIIKKFSLLHCASQCNYLKIRLFNLTFLPRTQKRFSHISVIFQCTEIILCIFQHRISWALYFFL